MVWTSLGNLFSTCFGYINRIINGVFLHDFTFYPGYDAPDWWLTLTLPNPFKLILYFAFVGLAMSVILQFVPFFNSEIKVKKGGKK